MTSQTNLAIDQTDAMTRPASVVARSIYDGRRLRDQIFAEHGRMFGEPTWDLLLDLYISEAEGRRISVMDGCIGSANPTTTALRHIAKLEDVGLVERDADPEDRRRRWLTLTAVGRNLMERFLTASGRGCGFPPE